MDITIYLCNKQYKMIKCQIIIISKKEIVLQQIADTVITDLLNKQVLSCYEVYNCNRTFKINDSDRIVRMDEGA